MVETDRSRSGSQHELTLGELDRDEAICEAIADLYGATRADLLKKAAFGGAVLLGALAAPPKADARAASDIALLNFDLRFEYLQATFYLEAVRLRTIKRMTPEQATWARVLGEHELAHVRILKQVLGRTAARKPFFDFHGVTERPASFIRTAVAMEDLTVALLAGQAPRLKDRSLVAALFSLLTVEARHAAWARRIHRFVPSVRAFDTPRSTDDVAAVVASTHFVVRHPRTAAKRRPRYTG
jgi:rubrerythrin